MGLFPAYILGGSDSTAIDGGVIQNNTIDGIYGTDGIAIFGKGTLNIEHNDISASLSGGSLSSMNISSTNSDLLNVTIRSNTIATGLISGSTGVTVLPRDTSQLTATIEANAIQVRGANSAGIGATAHDSGTSTNLWIQSNTVMTNNDEGYGVLIHLFDSDTIAIIDKNNITTTGVSSFGILTIVDGVGSSLQEVISSNQVITLGGGSTGICTNSNFGNQTATITENQVTTMGVSSTGIQAVATSAGFLQAAIGANQVTSLDGSSSGIDILSSASGTLCAQLTDNMTSPPSIELSQQGGSTFNLAPSLGNTPATFTEIGTITPVSSCD